MSKGPRGPNPGPSRSRRGCPGRSGTSQFNLANNGTEYFLSSNAADEAQNPVSGHAGSRTSTQLIAWTLTNTASLNTANPAVSLSNKILTVGRYGVPPKQQQPGSGAAPGTAVPQGNCLNDETTLLFNGQSGCWKLLVTAPAHAAGPEVVASPDSNDTRMQQVIGARDDGMSWPLTPLSSPGHTELRRAPRSQTGRRQTAGPAVR